MNLWGKISEYIFLFTENQRRQKKGNFFSRRTFLYVFFIKYFCNFMGVWTKS